MEIQPLPPAITRIDKAPPPAQRENPASVVVERPREGIDEGPERRRNPDRRKGGGKAAIERRISGNRRRRSIDISV